jgi:hypothetical protein
LRRADLLAALGELVACENGDLVGELFVDRLDSMDFLAHGVDLSLQLQDPLGQRTELFRVIWSRVGKKVMPWILPRQPLLSQLKPRF